jgi:hypothetical protein
LVGASFSHLKIILMKNFIIFSILLIGTLVFSSFMDNPPIEEKNVVSLSSATVERPANAFTYEEITEIYKDDAVMLQKIESLRTTMDALLKPTCVCTENPNDPGGEQCRMCGNYMWYIIQCRDCPYCVPQPYVDCGAES